MTVYIQEYPNRYPVSANVYAAWDGFKSLHIQTKGFQLVDELRNLAPEDLVVGGVGVVTRRLEDLGILTKSIDYPDELTPYLGRKIWKTTLDDVVENGEWPVFIKPAREKAFSGFVLRTTTDLDQCMSYNGIVYCSEVLEFSAEWRVFVRYGEILGTKQYKGDWCIAYDRDFIEAAVKKFHSAPAGFALDFGRTTDGQMVFVEMNDGYSLGNYGLDPVLYARLLSARWAELTGTVDVLR